MRRAISSALVLSAVACTTNVTNVYGGASDGGTLDASSEAGGGMGDATTDGVADGTLAESGNATDAGSDACRSPACPPAPAPCDTPCAPAAADLDAAAPDCGPGSAPSNKYPNGVACAAGSIPPGYVISCVAVPDANEVCDCWPVYGQCFTECFSEQDLLNACGGSPHLVTGCPIGVAPPVDAGTCPPVSSIGGQPGNDFGGFAYYCCGQ